jgi:nucleoside-diphosphate-sugar epimerase
VTYLITGAGGFLGRHLLEHLVATPGHRVLSLGLGNPNHPQVQHFECDLNAQSQLAHWLKTHSPERIFHLAGSARVSSAIGMPEYFQANVSTTQSLLAALDESGLRPSVFLASSVHVYGNQNAEVDEGTEPSPSGMYGFSKYLAERAVASFGQRTPASRVLVGRLYTCIGPGQGPGFVTSDIARKLAALPTSGAQPLVTGPLTAYRRFLDVRDAARIIHALMELKTDAVFDVVNIASPFEHTVREMVEQLVQLSGKPVRIEPKEDRTNTFHGLRMRLAKLQNLLPDFPYQPTEQTLRDIYSACSTNPAELS